MPLYGLIGYPLGHSFSKKYFTEKFEAMNLASSHAYELYPIEQAGQLVQVLAENPELKGINVTIPHKQAVMDLLTEIDHNAAEIGAVNVIKRRADGSLKGFNSDYYGFKKSLEEFVPELGGLQALVLGYGGAAKAVLVALKHLGIPFKLVSRKPTKDQLAYTDLAEHITDHRLIINCSPLGTYPHTDTCPDIPYGLLGPDHYLYDLVYNPAETLFMQKGAAQGAQTLNGLNMLIYQAEKAWDIWNDPSL
jgi:shikimate dehydrogenase